jgi:hypothetical protein
LRLIHTSAAIPATRLPSCDACAIRGRQDETVGRVKREIAQYLPDARFDATCPRRVSGGAELVDPARLVHAVAGRARVLTGASRPYSPQRRRTGWWSPGFTTAAMRTRTLSAT